MAGSWGPQVYLVAGQSLRATEDASNWIRLLQAMMEEHAGACDAFLTTIMPCMELPPDPDCRQQPPQAILRSLVTLSSDMVSSSEVNPGPPKQLLH